MTAINYSRMLMLDQLQIKGLKVNTYIGVHAWEQRILQPLLIDVIIPTDFRDCDERIEATIDYDKLCHLVATHVESNTFQLIETVANQVANLVKKTFNLEQVNVTVSKPHAIKNAQNISVSITR